MSCHYLTIKPHNSILECDIDVICQIIGCKEEICFEKIRQVCNTDKYFMDCPIYKITRNVE